jgi:hypothetical protein
MNKMKCCTCQKRRKICLKTGIIVIAKLYHVTEFFRRRPVNILKVEVEKQYSCLRTPRSNGKRNQAGKIQGGSNMTGTICV